MYLDIQAVGSTSTIKLSFESSATTAIEWVKKIFETTESTEIINEPVDNFNYPDLQILRKEFQKTGLYNNDQLNEIIGVYERLPKYQKRSRSTSEGKKRS